MHALTPSLFHRLEGGTTGYRYMSVVLSSMAL